MKEVPHSVCGCSYSFNARAYSRCERHPYNNRTYELLFISLDFMVQKKIMGLRLHNEYTYPAVNTCT